MPIRSRLRPDCRARCRPGSHRSSHSASAAAWLLALAATLPAQAEFSGRVEAGSDAAFRGFRQNNSASWAGALDYRWGPGYYLGGTVANDRSVGDGRLDLRAGIAQSLQLAGYVPYRVDGGVTGSLFAGGGDGPFRHNPNYAEAYGNLTLGPLTASASGSPDYFATGRGGYRLGGALRMPLLPLLATRVAAGWNGGEGVARYASIRTGGRSARGYVDYSVSATLDLPGTGASLYAQGFGTNLRGARQPRGLAGLRYEF